MALIPTAASADRRGEIEAACRTQQWMAASGCACIADSAMADLNETQRAWMLASAKNDRAEANRIQGEMTMNELQALGAFMAQNSVACQQ
ncbi:MAG: hypothetical protein GY791_21070 [Alphaproteobacteria bacterium]|nr:hypothetical protein [Alphaproteobacteria bacterium]